MYTVYRNKQPMDCDAQLAATQTGRWGKCPRELSGGNIRGNVRIPIAGLQMYVKRLWFVPSWLTHTHTHMQRDRYIFSTSYIISLASWTKKTKLKHRAVITISDSILAQSSGSTTYSNRSQFLNYVNTW